MQLFYSSSLTAQTTVVKFNLVENHHLVKVLRKKEGDTVSVTNGKGLEWFGKLSLVHPKNSQAEKMSCVLHETRKHKLHMAIAPPKNNARLEWFLEKSTEIGIDSIHLIICRRSERKTVNLERLQKIVLGAMKQSKQFFLPEIHAPIAFHNFIEEISLPAYIAHCDTLEKNPLSQYPLLEEHNTILIGPEGDFTDEEILTATKKEILPVSLGNTILRTETAGLVACHTVRLLQQRL